MIPIRLAFSVILSLYLIFPQGNLSAQYLVKWIMPYSGYSADFKTERSWLQCESCYNTEETGMPVFSFYAEGHFDVLPELSFTSMQYTGLSMAERKAFDQTDSANWSGESDYNAMLVYDRGAGRLLINIIPLRRNKLSGEIEKLIAFDLKIEGGNERNGMESRHYAASSVLSTGDWYRVAVKQTGIQQLTYDDLSEMGVMVNGLSSSGIRVHGYGGGMLPERAGAARYDDLPEVPVMMIDGGDGKFDPGDYILFYGQGPLAWKYNMQSGLFEHKPHLYSDESYYFITTGSTPGRRIPEFPQPQSGVPTIVNSFDFYDAYHPDEVNLIKSGKEWFGDIFDLITSRDYTFKSFVPETSRPLQVRLSAAARSTSPSSFTLAASGRTFSLFIPSIITDFNTNYARMSAETFEIEHNGSFNGLKISYNKPVNSATGWLNFIELNAVAMLNFSGGQFAFRKTGLQDVVEYRITTTATHERLWDVTDPLNPGYIQPSVSGGTLTFRALADTLREYILCDASSFLKPVFVERVANQDLHSMAPADMVILAHPLFAEEAARLATFHSQHNDFSVIVVQPQAIYNEFSSGAQDISAIRDFMKMLWHRGGEGIKPRFMLLFGDASYDYKVRLAGNTNFIPTFQAPESLHPVTSYATDDFFGCIDDNEGGFSTDIMDIGVGRLVVATPEEARMAVDKIIHYATVAESVHGDWRNMIAFVADDGDGNEHMRQADQIATMIDTTYKNYNLDKIFLDAYPQISTPGGQRAPDATAAINQRLEKGALIVNYTGHGGETGWTHERILEISDINSWTNYDRLPVFMTATCEFSRYDDPLRRSGGELVFLNPRGGGIALFTTARPTFGTPNFNLARNFYNIALKPDGNGMPFLGDLIRISKRVTGSDPNSKKFVLLGDPAMKMAYPKYNVFTTEINGRTVNGDADTLRALGEITISGIVVDNDRNILAGFNGVVTAIVFDKESQINTFGSDGATSMSFSVRRNIIYKGNVIVEDGRFSFTFIVPRDIGYQFGQGKISYYATNGEQDAAGYYTDIVIGGISSKNLDDYDGPEISIYMNNTDFRPGGFTDENPVLLAMLRDISGINTIGNGIGHDIVAILDGKTDSPYILNEYYQSELNTYQSGKVVFPFKNLSPGLHTLRLKAWDVNNNSADATITFYVVSSGEMVIGSFDAYPNPMNDFTRFEFDHNQSGQDLELTLSIFSLSGASVAELKRTVFSDGFRTTAFEWDGRNNQGRSLNPGFYIGRLFVNGATGLQASKSVKISIVR